ncbi:hypothetical protein AAFN60_10105 [Roseibacillus persicicus]|uniref:hypothetical protein n=1 Tax=Roseibacillus persicicus TaxID=454148 RepID=UPI00398B5CAB
MLLRLESLRYLIPFTNFVSEKGPSRRGCKSVRKRPEEDLEREDGKVAAVILPLDEELSKVPFETATFGLG